jgi:L-asparaginase
MENKHILIINTGGTISCVRTKKGFEPATGYIEKAFSSISALQHPNLPQFSIKEYSSLIDSSNITLEHWNQLTQDISENYNDVDGFIIFHGTDTMAYSASALSFMLGNLGKPVILTGSQLPLSEVRSDAVDNTITSLLLCAHYPINEVCIYFNQKLLRGNRTRKLRTHHFSAFDSPNFPPLAQVGIDIQLNTPLLLPKPQQPFHVSFLTTQPIANFRLFPGYSLLAFEALLNSPIKALILETYGTGNAPNMDLKLLKLLKQAIEKGILIINATQCIEGRVESHHYATGRTLEQLGVISAHDMTPEAMHCKLLFACSQTDNPQELHRLMSTNLYGEMSA